MIDLPAIAAKWGANGQVQLIAERENAVYKNPAQRHADGDAPASGGISKRNVNFVRVTLDAAFGGGKFYLPQTTRADGWIAISAIGRWTLCLCNYLGRGRADRGYGQPPLMRMSQLIVIFTTN